MRTFCFRTWLLFCAVLFVSQLAFANDDFRQVQVGSSLAPKQPILILGPMPIEANYFASLLTNVSQQKSGFATFYLGQLNGYPIVVAQTGKGLENTAAATAIAIERYHPRLIINQGTSGGHDPDLQVGDIVLGTRSVNIGNFKTPKRKQGEGSKPLTWKPMDLLASSGSAGEGQSAKDSEQIRYFLGDATLIQLAKQIAPNYKHGKVVEGTIGSANFWNNEIDRINWFHKHFGTSVEEIETSAAAQVAANYGIPFLGVRVLSNNSTNGGTYNPKTAEYCQVFVKNLVEHYIQNLE